MRAWFVALLAAAGTASARAADPPAAGDATRAAEGEAAPAAAAIRETVSFRNEVVPILTRAGCNSGTCHGTPAGKNGFRLSLRGYDPAADHRVLTREGGARRVDIEDPDRSLILLKPTLGVPHEGGRHLEAGSYSHQVLRAWIAAGARDDGSGDDGGGNGGGSVPEIVDLRVAPAEAELARESGWTARLAVAARFADGTERDVTALARFSAADESAASVSADGVVEGRGRGEAVAIAEYLGRMATARLLFVEEVEGFEWREPPPAEVPEAAFIDRLVFAKLRKLRTAPSELAGDAEFLRRAFLDACGILPAPEEARRFLEDPAPGKRVRLIDDLLARPEFAQFWAMHWTDRLGANQRFVGKTGAYKYHQWIVHAMAANVPEDELARSLIAARGGNYSNPAASFYRRLREPQAAAETVAQLFLGVRLECARCHNHPGERWRQDDYYGMAAFFAGVRFKDGPFFEHLYNKEETVYVALAGDGLRHPRTGAAVAPRFLGGAAAEVRAGEDPRAALGRWVGSPENPFFARAAANRIWYHLLGRGIVEPPDDFRITNPPANEELLEALAGELVRSGFDRKRLIRLIMNSRTYQLSSVANGSNAGDESGFSRARVRLLCAEQLLDAVSAAAGVPEEFAGLPLGFRAAEVPDGEYVHEFLAAFGRPARAMACECERDGGLNLAQALHLVGGETVERKVRADGGRAAALARAGIPEGKAVEELYLATLSRLPSPEEAALLREHLGRAADRRRAFEDIVWALLNGSEFLFQH